MYPDVRQGLRLSTSHCRITATPRIFSCFSELAFLSVHVGTEYYGLFMVDLFLFSDLQGQAPSGGHRQGMARIKYAPVLFGDTIFQTRPVLLLLFKCSCATKAYFLQHTLMLFISFTFRLFLSLHHGGRTAWHHRD